MLHSAYLTVISILVALLIAQCGQTGDAKKALLAASTEKATAEINKTLCEATRDAQGETIAKLKTESDRRLAAASSAMTTARAEQNRQAQIIEGIRRAPRVGDNCEAMRIKMIEDSKR